MRAGAGKLFAPSATRAPTPLNVPCFRLTPEVAARLRLSGRKRPCVLSGSVDTCDRSDMRGGLATSTCSFTSGDAGELVGEGVEGVEGEGVGEAGEGAEAGVG